MKHLLSRLFTKTSPEVSRDESDVSSKAAAAGTGVEGAPLPVTGLLGKADEMMFVLDEDERLAALSLPLLRLLGMREHEALGRPVGELFEGPAGWPTGTSPATLRFQSGDDVCHGAGVTLSPIPVGRDQRGFILALLSNVAPEGAPENSPAAAAGAPTHGCGRDTFSAAVKSMLLSGQEPLRLTAGRIELIGLHDLKAALGARWPALAVRARSITRSVLEKRLAPEDIFGEIPGDRYLICFSKLTVEEARLEAELMAHEIRERLLGETESAVTVEAQVERITLRETDVGDDVDLMPGLLRMMDDAREQRRRADEARIGGLLRRATIQLRPVLSRSLTATGLMIAGIDDDCGPRLAGIGTDYETAKMNAEIDSLLVGLVTRYICGMAAGQAPAIVVPVHYATLHERRFATDYFTLCRSIANPARARILFEVHGVAPDVPDLRLQELLSRLAPFSAHRLLRVSGLNHQFLDLNRFRLAMVTIDAKHVDAAVAQTQRKFRGLVGMVHGSGTFVGMTHNSGCRLLVHGVRDEDEARWLTTRGADFVALSAGAGGSAPMAEPAPPSRALTGATVSPRI